MEITCGSCATKLAIPDESLPKGVPAVTAQCPKCQKPIEIKLAPAQPAAAVPQAAPAPAPSPTPAPASAPASAPEPEPVLEEEEFVEGRRLAMACFDSAAHQTSVKTALEALGYTVHVPVTTQEALARLRRSKYEVLILQESYGGGPVNPVLAVVWPMAMSVRRNMCVGLVGDKLRTMDNLAAFALSVNFVVAEKEMGKIQSIVRHAVAENEVFYKLFKEVLHEAGRV